MKIVVPKWIGFEIELGNHVLNVGDDGRVEAAARALVAAHKARGDRQSNGLHEFDSSGFRVYPDHAHAEICSPLVQSASDLALCVRQARRLAGKLKREAEKEVGPMCVSLNNANRNGSRATTWGFHYNVLVSRQAFDRWRSREWAELHQQWVPFIVSSLPLFGTGKVSVEANGKHAPSFQLSQRAGFILRQTALETNPLSLINTRDETLADPQRYARFHVVWSDTNQMEFANWLKFGVSQILLSLIEEQIPLPGLALKDPLQSLRCVDRDAFLKYDLALMEGGTETALSLQWRLAEAVDQAVKQGCAASEIPDTNAIICHWMQTLDDLDKKAAVLPRRLDWCAKLGLLKRLFPGGTDDASALRAADLSFAEIGKGAFELIQDAGGVDKLEDFLPPTSDGRPAVQLAPREQCRRTLLQRFGKHLTDVSWDYVKGSDEAGAQCVIPLMDPLECGPLLRTVQTQHRWFSCLNSLRNRGLAAEV